MLSAVQLIDPRRVMIAVGHRTKVQQVISTETIQPFNKMYKSIISIEPGHKQESSMKLESLKEIVLDDMDSNLDKVYKKHIIHFTITEDSLVKGLPSIHTAIMDKTGHTIMCCLYNMREQDKSGLVFGSTISIVNPYYRVAPLTGQTVIRVDDPQSVLFHTSGKDETKCRFCFKPDPKFTCSRCKRAKYCGQDCQKQDYKLLKHKLICNIDYDKYF